MFSISEIQKASLSQTLVHLVDVRSVELVALSAAVVFVTILSARDSKAPPGRIADPVDDDGMSFSL
jgi:hypothetical protein